MTGAPPTYPGTDALGATPVAPAFTMAANDPRPIQVSISSEGFGQQGFPYAAMPPAGEPVFVDGWDVRFTRILVTVKNVRLNRPSNPPSDPASVGASAHASRHTHITPRFASGVGEYRPNRAAPAMPLPRGRAPLHHRSLEAHGCVPPFAGS